MAIDKMVELAIFTALAVIASAAAAKLYEWRQDVLHGRYIRPDDPYEVH
jgi:hypothetical protein